MQGLASLMYAIGFGGNALLFLYIEAVGVIRNPFNLINPLYHIEVVIAWVTTQWFWLLLLVTLAAFGVSALGKAAENK